MMKSRTVQQENELTRAHQEDSPLSPLRSRRSPGWASERRRLRGDSYEVSLNHHGRLREVQEEELNDLRR